MEDDGPTLARMRRRYATAHLLEGDVDAHPIVQFRAWLHDAVTAGLPEPNAMVLATADAEGRPSARHVLLKGVDASGFLFFTNRHSRKATELVENPHASLCFPWFAMERQVVVCGPVVAVSPDETASYWGTRPRESQIGAWASAQSAVVGSRDVLEAAAAAIDSRYPGDIPVPDFWGGFCVQPRTVEFWQGGPGRLHDRLQYRRDDDHGWIVERLAP